MTTHLQPWPAGTPCWTDIMVPDIERTQAFYSAVLGWGYTDGVPELGGYRNAKVGSGLVAGLCPTMPGMEDAPKAWVVYLATDDIEATYRAVLAAGGSAVGEIMDLGPLGAMALFTDPTGVLFGAWRSGEHTGFEVVDEAGAAVWLDLMSSDAATARRFYSEVFGYSYGDVEVGEGDYQMFSVPGGVRPAGGIGAADGDTTPGWYVCFTVADVDALADVVVDAGGAVVVAPYDFPFGRLMHVTGPDGETLCLMSAAKDKSGVA